MIIFFGKSYTKCGGEANSIPFYKNSKLRRSTVWIDIKFVFIVCQSEGLPKYIKTKAMNTCFYIR